MFDLNKALPCTLKFKVAIIGVNLSSAYRLISMIKPHSDNCSSERAWFSKMDGSKSAHSSVVATIAAGVNDPSAGSPTEALLRLVLPLSDKVCETSRSEAIAGSPQSELLTGPLNR